MRIIEDILLIHYGDRPENKLAAQSIQELQSKAENLPISDVRISVPDDSIIEKLAKKIIPEDLYKDCSGYPTVEDRNAMARALLIKGMKAGIELVRHEA